MEELFSCCRQGSGDRDDRVCLVLRSTQQKYLGIIGVAVDDIAGGGDEVWEQAISKWEVAKG